MENLDPANRKLLASTQASNGSPSQWLPSTRPLSDIRETTEPSLLGSIHRKPVGQGSYNLKQTRANATKREPLVPVYKLARPESRQGRATHTGTRPKSRQDDSPPRQIFDSPGKSSTHSIRLNSVPPRSSSRTRQKPEKSLHRAPAVLFPPPEQYHCISNRSHSESPIKHVVSRFDPTGPERSQRMPSKTIIKIDSPASEDLLEHPIHLHPRLKVDLQAAAPLFVGGSSVEGSVRITVDEAERTRHRKALTLERVSVDLLGVEEVSGSKRHIFLTLGNELVDFSHPPPVDMVESQQPRTPRERSWILIPSMSTLPFLITLPLDVGPPTFNSKHARIRYVLVVTLTIKDSGRQLSVRSSQDTSILSVYDPEKALVSLPSPLTASDEYLLHRGHGNEKVTVTAGLHRQVWVSGTNIFADVHIVNASRKTIKKLELQLERIVLCYRHAAAATLEMSASQARLFDQLERSIICKSVIKPGHQGWNGVPPHTADIRTCDLELPRGHATIKCHKYFEVRYYLNVVASSSHTKLLTVQLPIILIHMNSLDVPTNSVAQVAAAIEEKRAARDNARQSPRHSRRPSRGIQGRAFAAPRQQSLERQRAYQEDLQNLGRMLDASPRKGRGKGPLKKPSVGDMAAAFSFRTPPSNRRGRLIGDDDADQLRKRLNPMRSFASNMTIQSVPVGRLRPETQRASSALGSYAMPSENRDPSRLNRLFGAKSKLSAKASITFGMPRWPAERLKQSWRV